MADTRTTIIVVAAVVLGMALLGGILAGLGAPEEAWQLFLAPLGLVVNPVTLIIVLIVFLVRRNKHQQQQQQVVVHVAGGDAGVNGVPAADGPRLRCPGCKNLNPNHARFCGGCGLSFQPKASSTSPPSARP